MNGPFSCSLFVLSLFAVCPLRARLADYMPMVVRSDGEATVAMTFENEPLLATPDDVQVDYVCADGLNANGVPLGYPLQNEICKQEGEWLLKALAGDPAAAGKLEETVGTTPGLRTKYWQK